VRLSARTNRDSPDLSRFVQTVLDFSVQNAYPGILDQLVQNG
jgi:hypothetical protein